MYLWPMSLSSGDRPSSGVTLTQIRASPSFEIVDIKKGSSRFKIYSLYPRNFDIIFAKEGKKGRYILKI